MTQTLALVPGARIGVYEVTAPIGQGGMGQVYRATDTTLGRHVAIKVLPDAFAADTDRLARFEREAKTLASLNHPHIAAIYGFEKSAGAHALVMELVEGEDLSQRIARGAMPLDEAVPIATQIAEALEAAHEQGIVHRDLKPANIKVRADGTVKVLDFGLAKAMAPSPGSSTNLSMSPTITTPALTQAGMILGTAAYLSPEQAKGRPADQRSDLWAFGCVLFEMLTGARAFPGDDVGDTLAAVLRAEPEWRALPADTPASIRRLLRRCLEKDRKRRLSTAADARLEIEDALTPAAFDLPPTATTGSPRAWWQRALGAAIAFIVGGAISGSAVWLAMRPGPIRVTRTTIETSGATALVVRSGAGGSLAITPDGSRVVYTSAGQLVVRRLDQFEPTLLTGLGTPVAPFISPDGQWVGFFDGPTLKKVSIDGGPPTTLVEGTYAGSGGAMGATWSADDTIVFATTATRGLRRVSAAGGDVETLTTPDRTRGEVRHSWPELLPGGRSLLLTITRTAEHRSASDIAELDLTTGTHRVLISGGSRARYLPTGHLVYAGAVRGDTKGQLADYALRVVAFDVERQAVAGTPVPMVALDRSAAGGDRARVTEFHIAANGTLVYYAASDVRIPVWVDRQGRETPLGAPARTYFHPRLAPDGRRVVLLNDTDRGLWTWDVGRAMLTRAVLEAGGILPLWTPDGRSFVMSANPPGGSGRANLFQRATDGTGTTRRLTDSPNVQHPTGITPDGTHVVFYESTPTQQRDIRLLTLADAQTRPLVETPSDEGGGVVSPDGRWLAYESNRTGPHEIYVRPFPRVDDGVWQVSTAGGVQPLWSRSELFYVATDGALMAVAVEPRGAVWSSGAPLRLFAGRYFRGGGGWIGTRQYDVSTDGQRFLMLKEEAPDANQASSINVVQSWLEEVKRLVTTK